MSAKKIAFVLTSLRKGGAEGKAHKIMKALAPHFQIELFLFNKVIDYEIPPNVKVHSLGSALSLLKDSWRQLPIIIFRLLYYTRKHKIDITYAFDYVPNLICILNKVLGWRGKVIINHINNHELELETYSLLKKNWIIFSIKRFYPFSNQIVIPSMGLMKSLVHQIKIDHSKLTYIPNPVDMAQISQLSKEPLPTHIIVPTDFVFIHVGHFGRAKNHDLLIRAFAQLQCHDCQLWLIGRGTDNEYLKNLIDELQLENKVLVLGEVSNPFPYLVKADCLTLSSDYEGSPNVLLEALACKLPVIATDCDYGPREILSASPVSAAPATFDDIEIVKHGILVPVGNISLFTKAMHHALNNPELMATFAELALSRVQAFNIGNNVKTYIELIR
ncbi:MAG: glycosyltransferase [Cytophagales bacterium]|nr:glycosyltransferase [Cytophagales bacterium]